MGEGFEPPAPFQVQQFLRPPPSATRPPQDSSLRKATLQKLPRDANSNLRTVSCDIPTEKIGEQQYQGHSKALGYKNRTSKHLRQT